MSAQICSIPECETELSPRSALPTCPNCRASMGMWKKRGVKAILLRRSRLKKYDCRMATISDKKGK